MTTATASRKPTSRRSAAKRPVSKSMYAGKAAETLGLTLPELAAALGKEPGQIKPRTPVSREVIESLQRQSSQNSGEASPHPASAAPSTELGEAVRVSDTVLHSNERRRPRRRDFAIVEKDIKPFVDAYRTVQLPYVPSDIEQDGSQAVYTSPVTGNKLSLNLAAYAKCKQSGNFPIITERDRREIALKLGHLWCVHTTCIHCGGSLNPRLFSKLSLLLDGSFTLPLIGEGERVKFPSGHTACRLVMPKLVKLELEMNEFTGTDQEAIEYRKKQYARIAGEVLPEVRENQKSMKKEDILAKMLDILRFNRVNF